MTYTISTKHCLLTDRSIENINRHIAKIDQMIPDLNTDAALIDIVLKKNRKKRLNHVTLETYEENHTEKSIEIVTPKAPVPIYYDGTIKLVLPRKPLIAHLKGASIDEAINSGFEWLIRELRTYKGKHYVSNSEYFDHKSVRGHSEYFQATGPEGGKAK